MSVSIQLFSLQDYKILLLKYLIKNIKDMAASLNIMIDPGSIEFLNLFAVNHFIFTSALSESALSSGAVRYLLKSISPSLLDAFIKEKKLTGKMFEHIKKITDLYRSSVSNTGLGTPDFLKNLNETFLCNFNRNDTGTAQMYIENCCRNLNGGTKLPLLRELDSSLIL